MDDNCKCIVLGWMQTLPYTKMFECCRDVFTARMALLPPATAMVEDIVKSRY